MARDRAAVVLTDVAPVNAGITFLRPVVDHGAPETAAAATMSPAASACTATVAAPPDVTTVSTSTYPPMMTDPTGIALSPRSVIVLIAPPSTAKSYSPTIVL